MKELLTGKGWRMYHSCFCGGSLKEYYSHADKRGYEVRIRPTRGTYILYSKNLPIAGPMHAYQLEGTLKQYGLD